MKLKNNSNSVTKADMLKKLEYAQRSFKRMNESKDSQFIDVQDHFWSYLHAIHLIWFYFGKWVKKQCTDKGISYKGKSIGLVEKWKKNKLAADQKKVWNLLDKLRNTDAHVKPVPAKREEEILPVVDSRGRNVVTSDGDRVIVKIERYIVQSDVEDVDIFKLCEQGISIFNKFINDFQSLRV